MQGCNRCKAAGYPDQLIGFDKMGEDPETGKARWKLIDEKGMERTHKFLQTSSPEQAQIQMSNSINLFLDEEE